MHALYLTGRSDDLYANDVTATRKLNAISRAMAEAEGIEEVQVSSHADAYALLNVLDTEGVAFVAGATAEHRDALNEFKDRLRSVGFAAAIDPDVDRLIANHSARTMTASGATPEDVFAAQAPGEAPSGPSKAQTEVSARVITPEGYQTALALLAQTDGNPLNAAVLACTLLRTTGDDATYQAAVDSLLVVFPWTRDLLVKAGLIQGLGGPA